MKSKVNKLTHKTKNYRFNFWYRFLFCIFYLYLDHFLSKFTFLFQIFLHTAQHVLQPRVMRQELNVHRTRLNMKNIHILYLTVYQLKSFSTTLSKCVFFLPAFLIISQRWIYRRGCLMILFFGTVFKKTVQDFIWILINENLLFNGYKYQWLN